MEEVKNIKKLINRTDAIKTVLANMGTLKLNDFSERSLVYKVAKQMGVCIEIIKQDGSWYVFVKQDV